MSNWNHDLSQAPRGKMVPTTVKTKDGVKLSETYQREYIIAASHCGEVTKSYWVPDQERWCMFTKDVPPGAWMPWPENPFTSAPGEAAVTSGNVLRKPAAAERGQNIREGDAPRETDRASGDASGPDTAQFFLEDVGGGA